MSQNDNQVMNSPSSAAGDSASNAPTEKSITNIQEAGVDEADMVKSSDKNLYVVANNAVIVLERISLNERTQVKQEGLIIKKILVEGQRLILIGTKSGQDTVVSIFEENSDGSSLTKIKDYVYQGTLNDLRLMGHHLYLVINVRIELADDVTSSKTSSVSTLSDDQGTVNNSEETKVLPIRHAKIADIPCENLVVPPINDRDFRMTKVVSLDVADLSQKPQNIGIIGGGDLIYMSLNNLYIAKQGLSWLPFVMPAEGQDPYTVSAEKYRDLQQTLLIRRIGLNATSGELVLTSMGTVLGKAKDQWAFKEFEDNNGTLVVATTAQVDLGNDQSMAGGFYGRNLANYLHVLTEDHGVLKRISGVEGFGLTEDIRSVRFIDRTAYVVTFKKTDPLFAFDLKDLTQPKLLGELKIPGFSTYMHPVAEGRMVGLGFDADDQGNFAWYQGIQVSLFDTSNSLDLKRLDNHIHGGRGSYSDATGDHHAFFFDEESKLLAFPLSEVDGGQGGMGGNTLKFRGAVIYRVGDQELTEINRISHKEFMPSECQKMQQYSWWQNKFESLDINRIFQLDHRLISVSRFGVMAHDRNSMELLQSSKFENVDGISCQAYSN